MPRGVVSFHIAAGTTLALHDKRGREAGSLIVQLRDTTAQGPTAAVDGAIHDLAQGLPTSPAIPEPVGDLASSVVNSLKQVVDKTKVVADFVNKTAKVCV